MEEDLPIFEYAVEPLRGRRRWRWELWEGPTLAAAGWHVTSRHAEIAVRTAAAARAHERLGLRVLRPALKRAIAAAGHRSTEIRLGSVGCVLVARP
jgi:hypothetical protein